MTYPVLASNSEAAYPLQRSVRLRSSAQAYFSRTPPSSGNTKTFTFNLWIKRGLLSTNQEIYFTNAGGGTFAAISWLTSNSISITSVNSSVASAELVTSSVYRDIASWYMLTFAVDTTQATASNRVKIFVNGVQVTALNTATYPALNYDFQMNNTLVQNIGRPATFPSDFYIAEVNFINGLALTPASFSQTDPITKVLQPKKYTGAYGTTGYYLNFQDNSAATAAAIGKDSSGNGNNWTPNNISVTAGVTYDSMTDVPTLTSATQANYPTLNNVGPGNAGGTYSNANLNFVSAVANQWRSGISTMFLPSGKFYFEATIQVLGSNNFLMIGACGIQTNATVYGNYTGLAANGWSVQCNGTTGGTKYNNGAGTNVTNASFANWLVNDVLQCAVDVTNGRIWFGKNNVYLEGNPAAGTGASFTNLTGPIAPSVSCFSNTGAQLAVNFGQRPFTYTPPTGFIALNAYNLPTPSIPNGAAQFAATLYTGNGVNAANALVVTNTVNNTSFQPDFVWVKSISLAQGHVLEDAVRGTSLFLQTNSTAADQATGGGDVSSFNSNGFTLSFANARTNQSAATYVGWQWKGSNAAAVTNTSGSITSQVNANPTAGFSAVTFTAQTSGIGTVGHGLNIAPSVVITKTRGAVGNWSMYHASLGNTITMFLNLTNASTVSSASWNNTSPTSTVFTLGSGYVNAGTIVAYCFAEINGYSRFASYNGNGVADGPFVYTGFRPRYIMVKNTTVAGAGQSDWHIVDTSRNPANVANLGLWADSAIAQYTATNELIDIVSNGFKLRGSSNVTNASGSTFIYLAFAENPFSYSLAR
jgi:hypothetical protein